MKFKALLIYGQNHLPLKHCVLKCQLFITSLFQAVQILDQIQTTTLVIMLLLIMWAVLILVIMCIIIQVRTIPETVEIRTTTKEADRDLRAAQIQIMAIQAAQILGRIRIIQAARILGQIIITQAAQIPDHLQVAQILGRTIITQAAQIPGHLQVALVQQQVLTQIALARTQHSRIVLAHT
jgi:hypothetical protein